MTPFLEVHLSPLAWRNTCELSKDTRQMSLITKAAIERYFRKGAVIAENEIFCPLDPSRLKKRIGRSAETGLEGFAEIAVAQSDRSRKFAQRNAVLQPVIDDPFDTLDLPWRQTAGFADGGRGRKKCACLADIVEGDTAAAFRMSLGGFQQA